LNAIGMLIDDWDFVNSCIIPHLNALCVPRLVSAIAVLWRDKPQFAVALKRALVKRAGESIAEFGKLTVRDMPAGVYPSISLLNIELLASVVDICEFRHMRPFGMEDFRVEFTVWHLRTRDDAGRDLGDTHFIRKTHVAIILADGQISIECRTPEPPPIHECGMRFHVCRGPLPRPAGAGAREEVAWID